MAEELDVTVRLNTKEAQADLRGLSKSAEATGNRVGRGLRSAFRRGVGALGVGAGIGAGFSAVRSATSSGVGDVLGESFGLWGAQLADYFLGDLKEQAKAARSAREETIQAFGAIAGRTGEIPPEARSFFAEVRSIREEEEKGANMFRTDASFRGPGVSELWDRISTRIGELLSEAVDALAAKLNPMNWF